MEGACGSRPEFSVRYKFFPWRTNEKMNRNKGEISASFRILDWFSKVPIFYSWEKWITEEFSSWFAWFFGKIVAIRQISLGYVCVVTTFYQREVSFCAHLEYQTCKKPWYSNGSACIYGCKSWFNKQLNFCNINYASKPWCNWANSQAISVAEL